jgi:prepilin-type N-terminal cleavage/methylation domain-containing protein
MLNRTKKAFTLLELIVVLLVLGILAAIAVPTFATVKENAAERTFQASADAIARNAAAIAASSNDGDNDVSAADITAAAGEAGVSEIVPGLLNDTVGGYTCQSMITAVGTSVTAGAASCTSN